MRIKRQHAQKFQKLQAAALEEGGDAAELKPEEIDWNSTIIKRRLLYQEMDLVGYLRTFDDFAKIPRWCK